MPSACNALESSSLADLTSINNAPIDFPAGVAGCLLPRQLDQSTAKSRRQNEIRDGSNCAQIALSLHDCEEPVGRGVDRCPIWPDGFVGSISHSDRFAWSAVAKKTDMHSIGIDTETIADERTIQQLQFEIGTASEWELAESIGLTPAATFTTVFSAKESLYKCVYPLNPVFFGFEHVRIVDIDTRKLTLQFKPGCPNSFLNNGELEIVYKVVGNNVFTACWMEQNRGGIR